MARDTIGGNRHPVDTLAELRQAKAAIEARIKQARQAIIDGDVGLVGADHVARVEDRARTVLSRDKLEARFGAAAVAECCEVQTTVYVRVDRIPAAVFD